MKRINIILINIIVACIFCSCEKNIVEGITIETEKDLEVAHFSSKEAFIASVKALENDGVYPVALGNITSLATKNRLKSTSENTEEVEDSLINSDLMKEFLNSNYEIIIGDVYFKITEIGVIFSDIKNKDAIRNLIISNHLLTNCSKINYALGYNINDGMYKMNNHEGLYLFDSFRKIEPIDESLIKDIMSAKSAYPADSEFKNIYVNLSDKDWKKMRGLSVSERHYFNSKSRVDVKFYAENILFYFEMGVKTKAQKKNWIGIWSKEDVTEVMSGWDILNIRERLDKTFFSPGYIINDPRNEALEDNSGSFSDTSFGYAVGYSGIKLANVNWKVINLAGFKLNFRDVKEIENIWSIAYNKRKVSALYKDGKYGYEYDLHPDSDIWNNIVNSYEGIRIIENENSTQTDIMLSAYAKRKIRTDKLTAIIFSEIGDLSVNFKLTGYDLRELEVDGAELENLESRFGFNPNSVLYGAVRKHNTWRGVKLTIK